MEKIKMDNPIVEMDGDEMTRVIWRWIKEYLIEPYVDLRTEYYDLGIRNRDLTCDEVTVQAAEATKKYQVAVKCATITPNAARQKEYGLSKLWPSPNATIRAVLDGTVFRQPITVRGISPLVSTWKKPITIARHAYGDIYKSAEDAVPAGAKAELLITLPDGTARRIPVHDFKDGGGVVMGMHNTDASIASFARACFEYAVSEKKDLWFAAKDTISKTYDGRFKQIFENIYQQEYKAEFEQTGIKYFYTLIDDAVARVMTSEGGFIWAAKNYDGDVFSDMLAAAYGSLAMMTSVLVSPDGAYEYEAAHGTVQSFYYEHLKGKKTATNSTATIFAWAGALRKRAEKDGNSALSAFADELQAATVRTIEQGVMTGDIASISTLENIKTVHAEEFIHEVRSRMNV